MRFQKVLVAVFVLLAFACNGQSSNEAEEDANAQHEHTNLKLELNNGKKWDANAETTEGIENMISLVNNLEVGAEVSEYHQLSKELENEFTTIFKKCTMKGEAHNQLHNYLIPLKGNISRLKSDDLDVCRKSCQDIKAHLATYKNYFK